MSMEGNELERKVSEHDEAINKNILPRLSQMEDRQKHYEEQAEALKTGLLEVQMGQKDLANTVLKTNQSSTDLQMQSQNMISQLLTVVAGRDQSQTTVTVKKLETKEKVTIALISGLFSAGGIGAIFALFIK